MGDEDETRIHINRTSKRHGCESQVSSVDSAVSSATPTCSSASLESNFDNSNVNQASINISDKRSHDAKLQILNSPYLQPIISLKNSSLIYNKQLKNIYKSLQPTRITYKKLTNNSTSPSKVPCSVSAPQSIHEERIDNHSVILHHPHCNYISFQRAKPETTYYNVGSPSDRKFLNKSLRCEITLEFTGRQSPTLRQHQICIYQQHCGGNPIMVYQGYLYQGEILSFTSKRQPQYPFSVTLFIDGIMNQRLTACCEYRHKLGHKLGGSKGQFTLKSVKGSFPCYKCQLSGEVNTKMSITEKRLENSDNQDLLPNEKVSPASNDYEENKSDYEDDFEDDENSNTDLKAKSEDENSLNDGALLDESKENNSAVIENDLKDTLAEEQLTPTNLCTGQDVRIFEVPENQPDSVQKAYDDPETRQKLLTIKECQQNEEGNSTVLQGENAHSPINNEMLRKESCTSSENDEILDDDAETYVTSSSHSSDTDDDVVYYVDGANSARRKDQEVSNVMAMADEWSVYENHNSNTKQWTSYRDEHQQFDSSDDEDNEVFSNPQLTVKADVHVSDNEMQNLLQLGTNP